MGNEIINNNFKEIKENSRNSYEIKIQNKIEDPKNKHLHFKGSSTIMAKMVGVSATQETLL